MNAVDINGETAMHAAAYKNLPKVVKLLAAKGARIELWNGRTSSDGRRWRSPPATGSATSSRRRKPKPRCVEVMIAAGVTPPAKVVAKTKQIY